MGSPLMAIGRIPLRETETDRKFNSISAMNLSWECRRGSLDEGDDEGSGGRHFDRWIGLSSIGHGVLGANIG